MAQLSLPIADLNSVHAKQQARFALQDTFSHNEFWPDEQRRLLETKYAALFEETSDFNRKLVSFQANRTEVLHRWMKYREGFSAALVETLIDQYAPQHRGPILDPFAGSATTLLVAEMLGIDAVGIELLPHCHLAWEAKSRAFRYDLAELQRLRELLISSEPNVVSEHFPHLVITESAFDEHTEAQLMAYQAWFSNLDMSDGVRTLARFLLMSILEKVSYTRKDGQYLRWDVRSRKIAERNTRRSKQGKPPISAVNKGPLPKLRSTLIEALDRVIVDVAKLQIEPPAPSEQALINGSCLFTLPAMDADQFQLVITSPPYANRYDYTRTYALEMAYLSIGDQIFDLRQQQLSCTVENRTKLNEIQDRYASLDREAHFHAILDGVNRNAALREVNDALRARSQNGETNNVGVLSMIDQYFTELAFVFAELYRVCAPGAYVAVVNDNVRYAGEIVPVDTLSTSLAEEAGFEPVKIYVLPQRKGNSSQQMGKYGRAALRKSITIWRKPPREV